MDKIIEVLIGKYFEEGKRLVLKARHLLSEIQKEIDITGNSDELFRVMHTLKGNSAMFEQRAVEEISEILEHIYDQVRKNKIKLSSDLFELTDDCLIQIDELLSPQNPNVTSIQKNQKILVAKLNRFIKFIELGFSTPFQLSNLENKARRSIRGSVNFMVELMSAEFLNGIKTGIEVNVASRP